MAVSTGANRGLINGMAAECASTVGADGFGMAKIDRPTIVSNEVGQIVTPCRISIEPGGSLKLNRVTLTSAHLIITDTEHRAATTVQFDNSQLTGAPGAGFLLDLYDESDIIAVHHSTISYNRSVWLRVVGNRDESMGGGRLEVTNSILRSTGEGTEGIQLLAGDTNGGTANLMSVTLDSPGDKVVLAAECRATHLRGAPEECGPLDPEEFAGEG